MMYEIVALDMDGRHVKYNVCIVKDANSILEAKQKAAAATNNDEILTTGFYDAYPITQGIINKRKAKAQNEIEYLTTFI